jgi:organic hydroperoxide reductase OsmC/OhrA
MTSPTATTERRKSPPHVVSLRWENHGPDFAAGKYSRAHTWTFDGGLTVPASPSPHVVPAPWSNPANIDPEEAFLAAIASCHMLTLLWLASKAGYTVASYSDDAEAVLTKNEHRIPWVSHATLRPRIEWSGDRRPSESELAALHERAHHECFIANSVRTEIRVEPPQCR